MATRALLVAAALLVACGSRTGLDSPLGPSPIGGGGAGGTGGVATVTTSSGSPSSSTGAVNVCPAGCSAGTPYFPAAVPLQPPAVPASCSSGFEMNNLSTSFGATALSPNGAAGGTLDVQIATYLKPDHIRITGIDASNNGYVLVDTCELQTADYGDPTDGCGRPPDDSIRQYTVTVTPGTKSLTVDVTGACTPYYVRVLGLCEFDVVSPVPNQCAFRILTGV
jgi:hypothetical protein